MFLKKECDELGEWFADTFPLHTLELKYEIVADKRTGEAGESYVFTIIGPEKFRKQLSLLFRWNGNEELVLTTFFPKIRAAISEAIHPMNIKISEYTWKVPAE